MKSKIRRSVFPLGAIVVVAFFVLIAVFTLSATKISYAGKSETNTQKGRMLTIFDRGTEKIILTDQATIGDALREAKISIDSKDVVEPNQAEKLVASDYQVNIYRARPVVIVDGNSRTKVITAYQTAEQIISSAGIKLFDEDKTTIDKSMDVLADGAGLQVIINRATPVNLKLFGKDAEIRTHSQTVGQMLSDKGIELGRDDQVLPDRSTPITAGMSIRVWREGKQIISVDEVIPFQTDQIEDADRPVGYVEVKTIGENGLRSVSYETTFEDGVEVSRTEIASITISEPKKQVELIGIKGQYSTPSENENITWDYLMNQGFSRIQTAGIMGNLMQEHRFRTDGDGIAQWTGGRRDNLYAKQYPNNIYTQLDFLMEELNGSRSWIRDKLKAVTQLTEAVQIFQNDFEACGICREDQRIQYARDILASH